MSCCCPHDAGADRLFSRLARRSGRRLERRGLERSQRGLMRGLEEAGFRGARVLEIGCGTGHFHREMLRRGAAQAEGVDLAAGMIREARAHARTAGLAGRCRYHQGDFLELADRVSPAEVCVLDKVVCCYPDAHALLQAALGRTTRVLALTLPRDRFAVRAAITVAGVGMRLAGSGFRPWFHSPARVRAWIEAAGFRRLFEASTTFWLSEVYVR